MKRILLNSLVAVALALSISAANAISIAAIKAGTGTFQVGDKIFGQFSLSPNIAEADVDVSALGTQALGPDWFGISFQGPFQANNGAIVDYKIQYSVTIDDTWVNPNPPPPAGADFWLHDILASINASAPGGMIQVTESVNLDGFGLGEELARSTLTVVDVVDPPGESAQTDHLVFGVDSNGNPVPGATTLAKKVYVQKDILLFSDVGQITAATIINQRFSQATPDGGSTLLLLGSALGALGWVNWRRNKS